MRLISYSADLPVEVVHTVIADICVLKTMSLTLKAMEDCHFLNINDKDDYPIHHEQPSIPSYMKGYNIKNYHVPARQLSSSDLNCQ